MFTKKRNSILPITNFSPPETTDDDSYPLKDEIHFKNRPQTSLQLSLNFLVRKKNCVLRRCSQYIAVGVRKNTADAPPSRFMLWGCA